MNQKEMQAMIVNCAVAFGGGQEPGASITSSG